jgi:hypothetical protein
MIAQTMAECNFRRPDHPAYSLDLTLCDFFLFGCLYETIFEFVYETVEELEKKIKVIIEAISKSRLIAIFQK